MTSETHPQRYPRPMWGRGPNDLPPAERRRTTDALRIILVVAGIATLGAIIASALGASDMQVAVGVLVFVLLFGVLGGRVPVIQEIRLRTRAANDAQEPRQRIGQLLRLMIITFILLGVLAVLFKDFRWMAVALAVMSVVSTWYEIARARRRL